MEQILPNLGTNLLNYPDAVTEVVCLVVDGLLELCQSVSHYDTLCLRRRRLSSSPSRLSFSLAVATGFPTKDARFSKLETILGLVIGDREGKRMQNINF